MIHRGQVDFQHGQFMADSLCKLPNLIQQVNKLNIPSTTIPVDRQKAFKRQFTQVPKWTEFPRSLTNTLLLNSNVTASFFHRICQCVQRRWRDSIWRSLLRHSSCQLGRISTEGSSPSPLDSLVIPWIANRDNYVLFKASAILAA